MITRPSPTATATATATAHAPVRAAAHAARGFGARRGLAAMLALGLALTAPTGLLAQQGTALAFEGLRQDSSAPVEITADTLNVNQRTGLAVFTGAVVVTQGDLILEAPRVEVEGDPDRGGDGIREVRAYDGVTLRSATETARGETGVYDVATGILRLEGNVDLTQGSSVINGQRLTANLNDGTGVMEGRVRTLFQPGAARPAGQ